MTPHTRPLTVALLATAAAVLSVAADAAPKTAVATVAPAASAATRPADQHVTGTVTFTQDGDTLSFVADVDGLAPNTTHGFHIHEKGDLSDPGLLKAGGHYNPTHQPHGGPQSAHHHAGDLGNITADDKGHGHLTGTVPGVKLADIVGRSVIIHAKADDLHTQPTGDSGGRVAGGKIEAAKG
jgi:Cu-Zn family superoxide dismutase